MLAAPLVGVVACYLAGRIGPGDCDPAGAMDETDDDELLWDRRSEPDLRNQVTAIPHLGWVGIAVAFDVEGLAGRSAAQRASLEQAIEIGRELAVHACPEPRVVWLEGRAPQAPSDPPTGSQKQSPDAHVRPGRVGTQGARATRLNSSHLGISY